MRHPIRVLTLLIATPAVAASIELPVFGSLTRHGFSPDGLHFLIGDEEGQCAVLNTRTGYAEIVDDCAAVERKLKVSPSTVSRTSPDGKAKAEVALVRQSEGRWKENVYLPGASSGAQLLIERDGKKTVSAEWRSSLVSLDVYWSADGQKVAWVGRSTHFGGMDGSHDLTIVTGSTGPRVRLVAEKSLLGKVAENASVALEAKGLGPGFIGKALKARDATVIYFAPGYEEMARVAAQAVPGGASTEKLTWPAAAELVVALGKAAAGGKP